MFIGCINARFTDVSSDRASDQTKGHIDHTSEDAWGTRDTLHERRTGVLLQRIATNWNSHIQNIQMYHVSHMTWVTRLGWCRSIGNTEKRIESEGLKPR